MSRAGVILSTQLPTASVNRDGNSPMTSTMKIRDELLTCRLCSMSFRSFGKRPLALRCMHTFCEECVVSEFLVVNGHNDKPRGWLAKKPTPNQLVCPICEMKTPVGRDVNSCRALPVNPAIMELLEILERNPRDATFNDNGISVAAIEEDGSRRIQQVHHSPYQQNQQPVSNVVIVNGGSTFLTNASVVPPAERCPRGESPVSIQNYGRFRSSPGIVIIGDSDSDVVASSPKLVTSVNVGSVRAPKPVLHNQLRNDNLGGICWKSSTQQQQQQHPLNISSQGAAPSTSVHVGTSASASSHELEENSFGPGITDIPSVSRYSQLCSKCQSKPASVSIANASKMVSSQLCADCAKSKTVVVRNKVSQNFVDDSASSQDSVKTYGAKAGETVAESLRVRPEEALISSGGTTRGNVVGDQRQKLSQVFVGKKGIGGGLASRSEQVADSRNSDARCRSDVVEPRSQEAQFNRTEERMELTNSGLRQVVANDQVRIFESPANERPAVTCNRRDEIVVTHLPSADTRAREKAAEALGYDESTTGNGFQMMSIRSDRPLDSCAPGIEDIHPPPTANPPFNPDYETINGRAAWRQQHDQPSSSAPPYEEFAPSNFDEKRPMISRNFLRIDNQPEGIAGRNMGLSFVLPIAPPQPPKYEEVFSNGVGGGNDQSQRFTPFVDQSSSFDRGSDRDGVRLIRAFGRYSEISTQPGGFRAPSRITAAIVNGNRSGAAEVNVVITDRVNATVQVFTPTGECLSMLHVDDCSGCCLWTAGGSKRLVAATDHGVQVYDINGTRISTIKLQGFVLSVVSYQSGFIAVQSKALSIFTGPTAVLSRTVTSKTKQGQSRSFCPFDDIRDVAVNSQKDLVVLESVAGGATVVSIMTEDGLIKSTISASHSDPCGPLKTPLSIAVDSNHNVFVADQDGGGRIVMFGANGRFVRHILSNNGGSRNQMTTWPAGIAVGVEGQLYAIVRGDKFAEIRLYAYI